MTETAYSTKGELAYRRVRELILSGELGSGRPLNQEALARRLGLSTTPLREALNRLEAEGLVELGAHRDARVSALTAEEARDLLEVRFSLDPLAAALAAERRSRDDLRAIRAAAAELQPLDRDPDGASLVAHRRFHAAIYRGSHNELLVATLDGLWDRADRYRRLALHEPRPREVRERIAAEHAALVDAVARGDAAAAAETMKAHVGASLGAQAVARLLEAGV
jgi:DNA-binding GntR family transcriptional regulator